MLAVRRADFEKIFDHVTHEVSCGGIPPASIRLHFVRHDASGEPHYDRLIDILLRYLTHYCFKAERRAPRDAVDQNERYRAARKLFRDTPKSGQAGELLIFFLIEAVLQAPQVLKKMQLTTNVNDERKGSDGVHMRWNSDESLLEVIYGESKLWKSFSGALTDAFKSMEAFHSSNTKRHELSYVTNEFTVLDEPLKSQVLSFVDGENLSKFREVHACLVGYNWDEYKCLDDSRRAKFVQEFEARYRNWAANEMHGHLKKQMTSFSQKQLRLEFFFIPFRDVTSFREAFNKEL